VESERQVLVAVLVFVVGDEFFVDMVLVSVDPVVPDYVVDKLFFQRSSELVDQFIISDLGITILSHRPQMRVQIFRGCSLEAVCTRRQVRSPLNRIDWLVRRLPPSLSGSRFS